MKKILSFFGYVEDSFFSAQFMNLTKKAGAIVITIVVVWAFFQILDLGVQAYHKSQEISEQYGTK